MKHKWKRIEGGPSDKRDPRAEGELPNSRKRCANCSMEMRWFSLINPRVRKRCKLRIETQYRKGPKGGWGPSRDNKVPICEACKQECPTCHGTGVITRKKTKELESGETDGRHQAEGHKRTSSDE